MSLNIPAVQFWAGLTLVGFHFHGALGAGAVMIVGGLFSMVAEEVV